MLPSCSKLVCAHKRMRRLVHPSWCQCLSGMLASSLHAMHACTVRSLSVRSFSASTHARSGVQHVERSCWCTLRASARASATASTFSACAFAVAYAVWLGLAAVRSCMSVQASDVSSDVAPYLCRAIEPHLRKREGHQLTCSGQSKACAVDVNAHLGVHTAQGVENNELQTKWGVLLIGYMLSQRLRLIGQATKSDAAYSAALTKPGS